MSDVAIAVKGLGKRYQIDAQKTSTHTFGDALIRHAKLGFLRDWKNSSSKDTEFWALKDISFDIKHGDAVGVIGHNGAGKSTLLKILSRITEPTKGIADIYGRVGSLLEVGTGFHQELSGRDNVFLSGAILGMKRSEIMSRFDEIVAFAGIEKFIDTPAKRYSSGMFLRLAFAVAAHLEPDILLVDEVLAVGDLDFQKKCLSKMGDVASAGRTVLLVSHNMASIKELCPTSIVLKNGHVDFVGNTAHAIQHYSSGVLKATSHDEAGRPNRGWVGLRVAGSDDVPRISNTEPFEIQSTLMLPDRLSHVGLHCYLEDSEGTQIVHNRELSFSTLREGRHDITAEIPRLYLKPGVYTLYLKLVGERDDLILSRYHSERLLIDITDSTQMFTGKMRATLLPPVTWSIEQRKGANGFEKHEENGRDSVKVVRSL
jgi:lipopolysaccharide transport system ATP-binding protein